MYTNYGMILSNLDLISWFFGFSWFWADWITKCGLGVAGARGCWPKGLHQIRSESWLFYDSLHFHIYQIAHLYHECHVLFIVITNDGEMGMGEVGQGMADWNYDVAEGTGVSWDIKSRIWFLGIWRFSEYWLSWNRESVLTSIMFEVVSTVLYTSWDF